MQIQKLRYFLVSGVNKVFEDITWVLAGTLPQIGLSDPRCVSIGEVVVHPTTGLPTDLWFPIIIKRAAFDTSLIVTYSYTTVKRQDLDENSPTFGQMIDQSKPDQVVSSDYDLYSFPVHPGYVEITESQFNDPAYPPP